MITPGDFFKAIFDAFESLFWRVVAVVVLVVLAFVGLGLLATRC